MILPGTPAPPLVLPTLDAPAWHLDQVRPPRFQLLVFYRGYHCPTCQPR